MALDDYIDLTKIRTPSIVNKYIFLLICFSIVLIYLDYYTTSKYVKAFGSDSEFNLLTRLIITSGSSLLLYFMVKVFLFIILAYSIFLVNRNRLPLALEICLIINLLIVINNAIQVGNLI